MPRTESSPHLSVKLEKPPLKAGRNCHFRSTDGDTKFSLAGLIIRRGGETVLRYSRVSLPRFLLLIRAQDVRAWEMDGRNGEGEQ